MEDQSNFRKFTRTYETADHISTWTYDLDVFTNRPISVDIKFKFQPEKPVKKNGKSNQNTRRNTNVSVSDNKIGTQRGRPKRS